MGKPTVNVLGQYVLIFFQGYKPTLIVAANWLGECIDMDRAYSYFRVFFMSKNQKIITCMLDNEYFPRQIRISVRYQLWSNLRQDKMQQNTIPVLLCQEKKLIIQEKIE